MINSIRSVRRAKGLTLEEVGQRCVPPTTAQTIGRLETGTRTLTRGWMNRIAAALGGDAAGRFFFARLLNVDGEKLHLLPLGTGQRQQVVSNPPWAAVAVRLLRTL